MKKRGFTLIEIVLSISVIGILAAIVLIAINPQQQLAKTNNLERFIHISSITKALYQYGVENQEYPSAITTSYQNICATTGATDCIDLSGDLTPSYLSKIPVDRNAVNDWTGYQIALHPDNGKLSARAVFAELDTEIQVNPFQPKVGEVGTVVTSNSSIIGSWESVQFQGTYENPIVIGATNTSAGNTGLSFDSRSITSTGADVRLCNSQGPVNGCANHTNQTAAYMVLDLDAIDELEGIEAGVANISGGVPNDWNGISFTKNLGASPIVLVSPMNVSGDFPVEARVESVNANGFSIGLCHLISDNGCATGGGYPSTEVAWVAISPEDYPFNEIFNSGTLRAIGGGVWSNVTFDLPFTSQPAVFVENITNEGSENGEIAEAQNVTLTGTEVRFCEMDIDDCDGHADETLNWFALPIGPLTGNSSTSIQVPLLAGEAGTFTSSNSDSNGTWQTITFTNSYTNPIVIGSANSSPSTSTGMTFEVRNVTANSAEMRLCRTSGPTNGCDNHTDQTAGYVVLDQAIVNPVDRIEAGVVNISGGIASNWSQVNFATEFGVTPLVFTTPQELVGDAPLEGRVQNVNRNDFQIGLCHQRDDNSCETGGNYPATDVAWVAFQPGATLFQESTSLGVETGVTNSSWTGVSFSTTFGANPVMVVENQTNNGNQNGEINEARNITTTDAQVRYCEQDAGRCDGHTGENIAWIAIEPGDLYILQDIEI